jgi:hypothetical protein
MLVDKDFEVEKVNAVEKEVVQDDRVQSNSGRDVDKSSKRPQPPRTSSTVVPSRQADPKVLEIVDLQISPSKTPDSIGAANYIADPTTIDERLFKDQLSSLADTFNVDVDFEPMICGRKLPLFRLWQVVYSDEFGGYDKVNGRRQWPRVAKMLNYNEYKDFAAASELQQCYSEILTDFEEAREAWRVENPNLTESQEKAMIEDQLYQTSSRAVVDLEEEDDEDDGDLDRPLSTPVRNSSSTKRSIDVDRTPQASSINKRQRLDKGKGRASDAPTFEKVKEVPSTPEDVINGTACLTRSYNPSPPKNTTAVKLGQEEDREEGNPFVSPTRQPNLPPQISKTLPSNLDPETQDFQFDIQDRSSYIHDSSSPERAPPQDNPGEPGPTDPFTDDSSTQSLTSSQKEADLDTFIERWIALGYDEGDVATALDATSMVEANVGEILESLHQGRGIPGNIRGVWTESDDEGLGAERNSKAFIKVLRKHGPQGVNTRREFKEMSANDEE